MGWGMSLYFDYISANTKNKSLSLLFWGEALASPGAGLGWGLARPPRLLWGPPLTGQLR